MKSNICEIDTYIFTNEKKTISNKEKNELKIAQRQLKELGNVLGSEMLKSTIQSANTDYVISRVCKTVNDYWMVNSPKNIKGDNELEEKFIKDIEDKLKIRSDFKKAYIFEEDNEINIWVIAEKISLEKKLEYMDISNDSKVSIIIFREKDQECIIDQLQHMSVYYKEVNKNV